MATLRHRVTRLESGISIAGPTHIGRFFVSPNELESKAFKSDEGITLNRCDDESYKDFIGRCMESITGTRAMFYPVN